VKRVHTPWRKLLIKKEFFSLDGHHQRCSILFISFCWSHLNWGRVVRGLLHPPWRSRRHEPLQQLLSSPACLVLPREQKKAPCSGNPAATEEFLLSSIILPLRAPCFDFLLSAFPYGKSLSRAACAHLRFNFAPVSQLLKFRLTFSSSDCKVSYKKVNAE